MGTGAWVLVAVLVLAGVVGLVRALRDGRFRGTHRVAQESHPSQPMHSLWPRLAEAGLEVRGERATLVQFSSAFCAPCRATRRVLQDVAGQVPGVEHLEIDAEHHLALVRELGISRTPTTLVLSAAGTEVVRAVGAPRKEAVLNALGQAIPGA